MFSPEQLESQLQQMPMDQFMAEMRRMTGFVKKNPKNWEARYALAVFYLRTESHRDAVSQLKKAHKYNPRSEIILKTLCEVLFLELKDYKSAIGYLKKWSLIRKDLANLWIYIAQSENQLGRPEAALRALAAAEKIDPGDPEIRLTKADVFTKMGDEQGAQREYEKSFSETGQLTAISRLISLPNYQPDIETLLDIKAQVIASENSKENPKRALLSDIGSVFEKLKQYDEAFDCFYRSNEERKPSLDRDEQLALFKNVKNTFTREFLTKNVGQGTSSNQPIFIVGMPRSGTTLTESILAAHPKIIDNGELTFFSAILKKNGGSVWQPDLLQGRLPGLKEFFDGVPDGWFKKMGEEYLSQPGFKKGDKRLQVDKLPHNFLAVGLIHLTFPNAKIIHCRRHPVDGALSCYKAAFSEFHDYATDLAFLGSYYRNYWDLMAYWRELFPGKMFEICYEHVVSETENVARALLEHIGLDWDDRCLDHTKSQKSVRTASQWQVRQPIYTSSVAKWRNYEEHLQPMIKSMGSIVGEYETELESLETRV